MFRSLILTKERSAHRTGRRYDFFDFLLWIYFFTLHADLLSFTLGEMQFRFNNLLALTLLFILGLRYRGALCRIDRKLLGATGALLLTLLLSLALSPHRSRCTFFLIFYIFTLVNYCFLPYLLMMHWEIQKLLKAYLASFLWVGLYGLFQFLLSLIHIYDPFAQQFAKLGFFRPNAFAYEPSFLALYLTPFIVIVNLHSLLERSQKFYLFRELKLPMIFVLNLVFLMTTSTGAYLSYFLLIFILLVLAYIPFFKQNYPSLKRNITLFTLLFGLLTLLIALSWPQFTKDYIFKFFYSGFKHHSFIERWVSLSNTWQIFMQHPWCGIGLGALPPYLFQAYITADQRFQFIDFILNREMEGGGLTLKNFEPANVTTELLASLGLLGFLLFAALVSLFFYKGIKAIKMTRGIERHWALLFLLSMALSLIILQFSQGLFRTYVWVHFALGYAYFVKVTPLKES